MVWGQTHFQKLEVVWVVPSKVCDAVFHGAVVLAVAPRLHGQALQVHKVGRRPLLHVRVCALDACSLHAKAPAGNSSIHNGAVALLMSGWQEQFVNIICSRACLLLHALGDFWPACNLQPLRGAPQ